MELQTRNAVMSPAVLVSIEALYYYNKNDQMQLIKAGNRVVLGGCGETYTY